MSEESKKATELTDEEVEKAAGGMLTTRASLPDNNPPIKTEGVFPLVTTPQPLARASLDKNAPDPLASKPANALAPF